VDLNASALSAMNSAVGCQFPLEERYKTYVLIASNMFSEPVAINVRPSGCDAKTDDRQILLSLDPLPLCLLRVSMMCCLASHLRTKRRKRN